MIGLRAALSEMNRANAVFAITYNKVDGRYGEKKRVTLRRSENALNDRKKSNRSGMLRLINLDSSEKFEVYIDFLRTFNGEAIDHRA